MKSLLPELRRRGVIRAAALYVAVAWGATEILAFLIDALWPASDVAGAKQLLAVAFVAGFPVAMYLAWSRDLGLHGRRVLVALTLALATGGALVWLITDAPDATEPGARHRPLDPAGIAVLPLENLSGDPEQAYFVAGMQEALIADLARIGALKVISRTSARQYQDTDKPLPVVAAELGVANLVEGSVFRVGDRVRITVQLIDARSDRHLWAESYERELEDVLRLQSEVARAIAHQVRVSLTEAEEDLLKPEGVVDPRAYELYLKGRFHWGQLTEEDLRLAIDYFQAAIDRDPDYALAYVGYADATATLGHVGIVPAAEVFPVARDYVERALALDDSLAEAHDLLARIRFAWEWDWAGAGEGFERAIALKPNYPDVYVVYSQYLAIVGRPERVLETVLRGLDLDPLSAWFQHEHASRLMWLGRYDEALEETERLLATQPGASRAHRDRWILKHLLGADADAVVSARAYHRLNGEDGVAGAMDAGFERGGYAEAMMAAARTLTTDARRSHVDPVDLAELYAHAGRMDLAMDALAQALGNHESALVYTTVNPLFEPLWDDPRFMALRRAMNLPAQRAPLR